MEATRGVLFYGLLLLPLFLPIAFAYEDKERSINMVFYMHYLGLGPKATFVQVTATLGNFRQPFGFGTTMVMDDVLTLGPSRKTTTLGRGQGFYISNNIRPGTIELLMIFTTVMHSPPQYNGSTLCFMGLDRVTLPQRDVVVVGGTGAFRFACGFATIETIKLKKYSVILKFNATLRV